MEERTALVTGASRGIGAAIARKLAADGLALALTAQNPDGPLDDVAEECREKGVSVITLYGDCAQPDICKGWVKACLTQWGRLDVLVNNAGITKDGLLMRMSNEQFADVLHVNLYSAFYLCREAARPMMKQRSGRVINISSVAGVYGNAGQVNYAAAKAGLVGMTKSMAKELGSRGITVNAVAPGVIETRMTDAIPEDIKSKMLAGIPLGRMGRPEEVAGLVSFLAGDTGGYITGQVIVMDGGLF